MREEGWVDRHISWRGELREGAHITVRKHWNKSWARRMRKDDYAIAYDKGPADGGTQQAIVRITHVPYKDRADGAWIIQFEVVELIKSEFDGLTGHHDFTGGGEECDTCSQGRESSWHERSNNG